MEYKELHIKITGEEIIAVDWGGTDIPFALPEKLELERMVARVFHKVLNIHLAANQGAVLEKEDFKVLGKMLFRLLFSARGIYNIFKEFYREAVNSTHRRYKLILEFDKSASDLAALPWEYLYFEGDEEHEAFIAAHPRKCIDLIRKLPLQAPPEISSQSFHHLSPPVNILLIISNPDGQLHIENTNQIQEYFREIEAKYKDKVKIKTLSQPSTSNFRNAISTITAEPSNFFPHIIHFVGHGKMEGDSGQLAFVKDDGEGYFEEEWIGDEEFAAYLEELPSKPALIFLHVCDGARIGDYKNFKGLALQIARKKIPAIIAMQNPITQWIANEFTQKIYDNFLGGDDLDAAITKGRFFLARQLTNISGKKYDNYNHKAFGSPVLFTYDKKPLLISAAEKKEPPPLITNNYKICPKHRDKKFPSGSRFCDLCGSALIAASEAGVSSKSASASPASTDLDNPHGRAKFD